MKRLLSFVFIAAWLLSPDILAFDIRLGQTLRISMPSLRQLSGSAQKDVAATALHMLQEDLHRVLQAQLLPVAEGNNEDISCTFDHSLPTEGFRWEVTDKQLRITAANAHGIAYGLLELSRKLGVSPWEDWANVTPLPLAHLHLDKHDNTLQAPKVAFRGIFINDEDWGLNPWATKLEPEAWVIHRDRIKGAVGPKATERIFRLMLRLRLNYYWPPMHECTQPFFLTPGNREMAARYGIYVGGSHCEPMACSAAAEWGIRGEGDYNYVTNRVGVHRFWQERLDSVKGQDILYTLGMRGVHDGAMQGVKTKEEKLHYLQQVIDDQRTMLTSTLERDVTHIPQVFVPYKEVLDIYLNGLRVPEDVTLMWTDDNYGYVRHFPDSIERNRLGGNGLYYHVSYWGRPHDYCWLSTLSPYLMEQQLTEAYHRGIQRIWMLNVGDIKPAELHINLYSELAWNGVAEDLTKSIRSHSLMRKMLQSAFPMQGKSFVDETLACLNEHFRLAWDRKPEHMAGTRVEEQDKAYWNEIRPVEYWSGDDVSRRTEAYQRLSDRVERLYLQLPQDRRDAFFQLVKYPIQGAAQMNLKYLSPELTLQAQDSILQLTRIYNRGIDNGGKWDGIMTHAPRALRVFQPVEPTQLPVYTESAPKIPLLTNPSLYNTVLHGLGTKGWMLATEKGKSYRFPIKDKHSVDSIKLTINLLPTMPVDGGRLTFCISVDDGTPQQINFETYDRSEDWKQNVLRNSSERTFVLPLAPSSKRHHVTFRPLSEHIILDQIYVE